MDAPAATWLLLTIPAGIAGAVLLVTAIRGVVRASRREELARLRVTAEQPFALRAPGPVELLVEGPLFTRKLGPLAFAVHERDGGRTVPMRPILFRRATTTLDGTTRLALRRFTIDRPADLVLRITGLDSATDYADCAILLTPPVGMSLPLWIVGIVLSALLFLGGVVLSIVGV